MVELEQVALCLVLLSLNIPRDEESLYPFWVAVSGLNVSHGILNIFPIVTHQVVKVAVTGHC